MKKIIVAVSGGPDSMALLDTLVKTGKYYIVVAHVNYQKRETAYRDEKIVKAYCETHHLIVRTKYPEYHHDENFQAWARDVRYDFFVRLGQEYGINDLYVAHHKDDAIETYIFQKQRGMLCDYYGMKEESMYQSMRVHRPLLSYTKKQLQMYCDSHHIEYGIDESNLSNDYTRNKIRHSMIDGMTDSEKNQLLLEAKNRNEELKKEREKIKEFFHVWDSNANTLLNQSWMYLEYYLYNHIHKHYSRKYCQSLMEQLNSSCLIDLESHYLERFIDTIYLVEKEEKINIELNYLEYKEYPNFILGENGKVIEGLSLKEDDFPIRIRTVQDGDSILLRYGKKNVHRFFVDRKIPRYQRLSWIVIENRQKEVIFVPGIGCDVYHFSVKPNLFVLEYKMLLKEK